MTSSHRNGPIGAPLRRSIGSIESVLAGIAFFGFLGLFFWVFRAPSCTEPILSHYTLTIGEYPDPDASSCAHPSVQAKPLTPEDIH